jgi:hypothetical protein
MNMEAYVGMKRNRGRFNVGIFFPERLPQLINYSLKFQV